MQLDPLVTAMVIVSASDEALDMSMGERVRYAERRVAELLRVKPGETPVRFAIRPLSAGEANGVDAQNTINAKAMMCFALGCTEVAGADANGPNASAKLVPSHRIQRGSVERCVWSDDQLDQLQEVLGRHVMLEVGAVIFERTLRGKKATSGSVRFTVPHSLLDVLAQMPAQRAEPQPDESPTEST